MCHWTKHEHKDGRSYFYNTVTRLSQWEKPASFVKYVENAQSSRKRKRSAKEGDDEPKKKKKLTDAERALKLEEIERVKKMTVEEREKHKATKLAGKVAREEERGRQKLERAQNRLEDREKARALRAQERKVREEERKLKLEEDSRLREEDRLKKAEERRLERLKKEEEKRLEKEEELRKKAEVEEAKKNKMGCGKKQAAMMAMFVSKKAPAVVAVPVVDATLVAPTSRFKPFQLQQGMSLAAIVRVPASSRSSLEAIDSTLAQACLLPPDSGSLLAKHVQRFQSANRTSAPLHRNVMRARGSPSHSPIGDREVVFVPGPQSAAAPLSCRMKLLQFHEDVRPAYYGTFCKRSRKVHARRPLFRDTDILDYEHDSEGEWEPEALDGDDCLSGDEDKDDDDDKPGDEDGEDEDGDGEDRWIVPEGYLSDDERGVDDGDTEGRAVAPAAFSGGAAPRRARQTLGCLWGAAAVSHAGLGKYALVALAPTPVDVGEFVAPCAPEPIAAVAEPADDLVTSVDGAAGVKGSVPRELYPAFVRLVHGSALSVDKIIEEFIALHPGKLLLKDDKFSVREKRGASTKLLRYVSADVLAEHAVPDLLPKMAPTSAQPVLKRVPSKTSAGVAKKKSMPPTAATGNQATLTSTYQLTVVPAGSVPDSGVIAAAGSPPPTVTPDAAPEDAAWTAHVDQNTGATYYYNHVTLESSWHRPDAWANTT